MDIPSLTTSGTNVIVGFTTPNNHGSSITVYKIFLKKSDNSFSDATSLCSES